jgi:hypothetical protein
MARRSKSKKASRTDTAPAHEPPRTLGDAVLDALPDALAAGACLLAWTKPQAFGSFDLIAYAAPLFFIQLPLSIIGLFTGVTRLSDQAMGRATKAGFVLAPSIAMALLAPILLGVQALVGVLLLSAESLWRIATGQVDRDAPVKGAWITYTQGEDASGRARRAYSVSTDGSQRLGGRVRQWRVEAGHRQVMASLTATAGVFLLCLLPFIDVEPLGATRAVVDASAWSQTLLGQIAGAHHALAGGVFLFAARLLLQFEGIAPQPGSPEAAPLPTIEDDPVLREIIRKVDARNRD